MPIATTATCPFTDAPSPIMGGHSIWSLLDMTRYQVRDLHGLLVWLDHTIRFTYSQENYRQGDAAVLNVNEKNTTKMQVSCIRKHFLQLELDDSLSIIDDMLATIDTIRLGELRGHLLSIRSVLIDSLQKRVFMYIPQEVSKYARAFELPTGQSMRLTPTHQIQYNAAPKDQWVKPFGDAVFDAFKDAQYDAEQVALCVVVGASTASVFHLMRVVEWGVRKLGDDLGVKNIKEILKPPAISVTTGARKKRAPLYRLKPIESCTWETIQGYLRKKADKKVQALRPGAIKDKQQMFYASIFHDFNGFKDAWRNHVMHTKIMVQEDESLIILGHVKRFMAAIAEH